MEVIHEAECHHAKSLSLSLLSSGITCTYKCIYSAYKYTRPYTCHDILLRARAWRAKKGEEEKTTQSRMFLETGSAVFRRQNDAFDSAYSMSEIFE